MSGMIFVLDLESGLRGLVLLHPPRPAGHEDEDVLALAAVEDEAVGLVQR